VISCFSQAGPGLTLPCEFLGEGRGFVQHECIRPGGENGRDESRARDPAGTDTLLTVRSNGGRELEDNNKTICSKPFPLSLSQPSWLAAPPRSCVSPPGKAKEH